MNKLAVVALLAGIAMILVAGAGVLTGGFGAQAGTPVILRLVGAAALPKGTSAVLHRIGADAMPLETKLRVVQGADGGVSLTLPVVDAATVSRISLVAQQTVLWQTTAFLDMPVAEAAGPAKAAREMIAEPMMIRPLIDSLLECPAMRTTLKVSRMPGEIGLSLRMGDQTESLSAAPGGWTAFGLTFAPRADGGMWVTAADGTETVCLPKIPAGLRPMLVSGPGWALSLDAETIAWIEAGKPPALFATSGTLSEATQTGTAIVTDRILFRSPDPDAPTLTAHREICVDPVTSHLHDWRLEARSRDGVRYSACVAEPRQPEDGIWTLTALNGVTRRTGGQLNVYGPLFSATTGCHHYEGHLLRYEAAPPRMIVDRHQVTDDCDRKSRAMAEALDAALASGAVLKDAGDGDIGIVAEGDDLDTAIYILARRDKDG